MPPSDTLRVAILLDDLTGGGVERTMLKLAGGLAARGHEVEVLVAEGRGALVDEVPAAVRVTVLEPHHQLTARLTVARADPAGVALLARPVLLAKRKHLGRMTLRLPSLAKHLRDHRPHALLSAKLKPNLCAVWARALAGVPTRVVVTERTSPTEHFPDGTMRARHRAVPRLMRRYYPRADKIVTVAHALADDLARFSGIARGRIDTVYNPVVDERLRASAAELPDHPWFNDGGAPIVLSAGRLELRKDFATLVRAFAIVRQHRPLRLVILGDGKRPEINARMRDALLSLARELGVQDDVSLPGFALNPFAYMARAGVFVLPSQYEGLPGVLIQAMACGCPVVSTDCPTGPKEILEEGRHGRLVPVSDPTAMAEAIARTLDQPPAAAALRARAAGFSVDAAVDAYLALLRNSTSRANKAPDDCPRGMEHRSR